jgi:hypothetical protein
MKVYFLNPQGVMPNPHLFPLWEPTWRSLGWEFQEDIRAADLILFDLHSRLGTYNQDDIDWIVNNPTNLVSFDEWDRGNMSTDIWPNPLTEQQKQVFNEIYKGSIRDIHFCRLLDKTKSRRHNIFPYEKPILYQEPMLSADDLFNREFDVVFIANSAPSREAIATALREDGRLSYYISLGAPKIEFTDFVNKHRNGKMFISSAAGGFTDERCQHLFSVAAIIRQRNDQVLLHDFTHFDNCVRIDSPPTKEQIDMILSVVNNKEELYEIYKAGYEFMTTHYSPQAIATNIYETVRKCLGV